MNENDIEEDLILNEPSLATAVPSCSTSDASSTSGASSSQE